MAQVPGSRLPVVVVFFGCATSPPSSPEPVAPSASASVRLHAPTGAPARDPAPTTKEPCPTVEKVGWEARTIAPSIAGARLACGGAVCAGSTPPCCEGIESTCHGPAKCVARTADRYPTSRILACLGARDCPKKTRCYISPAFGTACAASSDGPSIATCASEDECREPARCVPHPDMPSVRHCRE